MNPHDIRDAGSSHPIENQPGELTRIVTVSVKLETDELAAIMRRMRKEIADIYGVPAESLGAPHELRLASPDDEAREREWRALTTLAPLPNTPE